jgi:hypothetical protein
MHYLALVAALTFTASAVLADALPPPPPKGQKSVGVVNSVAVEKSVTGYTFVQTMAEGPRRPTITYAPIKLTEKAAVLAPSGKKVVTAVIAIPEEEAKKYATEKELLEAIATIPGAHRLGFTVVDTIPSTDKRDSIPWKYTITAIDAKKGITVSKERDGKQFVEKEPKENSAEEEPPGIGSGSSRVPAGVFASAAMVSLGLWRAGRRRVVR